MTPDRTIVEGIAAGDAAVFRGFYDQASERLLRFIFFRVGGDMTMAEEILQESFARLCADPAAVGKLPSDAMLVPWLCGVARRIIADWARSRAGGRCISLESLDPVVQEALLQSDDAEPPTAVLDHPQMRSLVGMVMSLLPAQHAAALTAKYCDGLSVDEIAARERTSAKTIEGRLYRARESFRAAFAQVRQEIEAAHG